ncbi:Protein gts1 [Blastocladiella emersonii ATCC 22665]|nr:Protein gts1 [Blastocladiella emersonii ATCC 22665]
MTDRERRKQQEQQERIFNELLRDEANQYCADCGARGPKWASWNIGVFLCIKCGGVHRKLGTHISKVKSITLDTWTPEQIDSIRSKGNARANSLFNPNGITPPRNPSDSDLENYIRDKYERQSFMNATGRATFNTGGYGGGASSSSHQHNHASHGSGGGVTPGAANRWAGELRSLHDMGFTYDAWNVKALEQTKGDLQAAIDVIIGMGPPPASAPTPSVAPPPRAALDSRTIMAGAKVTIDASAPALRQLKGMGFTDENLNLVALQKADGDLDGAITLLTDRASELKAYAAAHPTFNATAYAQQFMQQQQQQQQHQNPGFTGYGGTQQPRATTSPSPALAPAPAPAPAPAKPKNDLLDLFGDIGGDPFAAPAPAQPSMMSMPPAQASPFGAMGGMGMPAGNPFAAMQAQQQPQQAANPFGAPAPTAAAPANPFGDFGAAPQQQQQQAKTGGGGASDILSLYNQPTPQQLQQQQMQQQMMMQQQQQAMLMQQQQQQQQQAAMMQQQSRGFGGGAGMGGMGMVDAGASPFGGMGYTGMQQPQGMVPTGMSAGSSSAGGGMGMMGGAMGGMGMMQQGGMMGMGMGGMGATTAGGSYSTPFSAAQQPKAPGPGSAFSSTGTPSMGGFGAPAAAPQPQANDPFAGFGNVSAFTAQQQKPAGSSNPFL